MSARFTALAIAAATVAAAWSRTAQARGCTEVSDIVGYEHCARFGSAWSTSVPRLSVSLDVSQLTFDPTRHTVDLSQNKISTGSFSGRALGAPRLGTFAAGWRLDGYLWGPIYAGFQNQFGFGMNGLRDLTTNGTPTGGSTSTLVSSSTWLGIVGLRVPLGRVSLRLESAMGGTMVSFRVAQQYGTEAAWTVEPRAMLDVWVSPNITMGAYAGVDALDPVNRSFGLTFGLHTRSFDGAFALW